jgi:hypothetical protein
MPPPVSPSALAQLTFTCPAVSFGQQVGALMPADATARMDVQVVEYALGLLPTKTVTVKTPTKAVYSGMHVNASVCGVSVIRSGEAMENALRSCWKGIDIGKILVQRRHHGQILSGTSQMERPDRLTCDWDDGDDVNGSCRTSVSAVYEDAHGRYYQNGRCGTYPSATYYSDARMTRRVPQS